MVIRKMGHKAEATCNGEYKHRALSLMIHGAPNCALEAVLSYKSISRRRRGWKSWLNRQPGEQNFRKRCHNPAVASAGFGNKS